MVIRRIGVDMMNFIHNPMSERDLDNLEFLLTASNETLTDWFSKMEQDDIDYAFELLEMAKLEMIDQATELSSMRESTEAIKKIMEKSNG
jgi:hypothetical protein